MPRDLPLSNGTLLLNFDSTYQLRDFYYPHVGKENHSTGGPFRFGIWTENNLRWITDQKWSRQLDYEHDTLVTRVTLAHPDLALQLLCNDAVDFHENLYLRRIDVTNQADHARQVRLFFHHDFHISETEVGDTAYYEPQRHAVLHYKGQRWFLIGGCRAGEDPQIDQWATGLKEIQGREGTWRDAEDGTLSGNPIAQGSVDSTIALHVDLNAGETKTLYYWVCVGNDFQSVTLTNRLVRERGPQLFIDRTAAYWRLWVNKEEYQFSDLPHEIVHAFKQSLLILRTQIDNAGGIIAANDSDIASLVRDTYSYVWPRDGALVAHALDLADQQGLAQEFFNFCANVITAEGYFLHKYNPDGSLASSWHPWYANGEKELPVQEDETGLVLWALWEHFDKFRDVEFIKPLYRTLVTRAADWMAGYRDANTGLPLPSWDLWEERRGVHAFTVAAVWAGLNGAANFADAFGETDCTGRWRSAAERIKAASDKYLWQPNANRFVRRLIPRADGGYDVDGTIDSAVYALFQFGLYAPNDPRVVATMEHLRERLWVKSNVGGMARYENDYYHQVSQDIANVPGNPWFICTLWLAAWHIAKARSADDLKPALDIFNWVAQHALASGVLAEQVNPYTDAPMSVSPLTWSHAALVTTVLEYLDKLSELALCPTCGNPRYSRELGKLRSEHTHHHFQQDADRA
ncbi:MAG: glycoside hydrolase family 15 protein [Chloroflexota bacterium]|nr:glycoside hydrolase family 15 protein [Chloroflexota bacterium]